MEYTVISCTKEQLPKLEELLFKNSIGGSNSNHNRMHRALVNNNHESYDSGVQIYVYDDVYLIFNNEHSGSLLLGNPTLYTFEEFKAKHNGKN